MSSKHTPGLMQVGRSSSGWLTVLEPVGGEWSDAVAFAVCRHGRGRAEAEADAAHLAACWNACAGLADPAKDANEELVEALRGLLIQYEGHDLHAGPYRSLETEAWRAARTALAHAGR